MICPLAGKPSAQYRWERFRYPDGTEPLELSDDLILHDNGRKWTVDAYTEEHNGMYVCHAANNVGNAVFSDQAFFLSTQGKYTATTYTTFFSG